MSHPYFIEKMAEQKRADALRQANGHVVRSARRWPRPTIPIPRPSWPRPSWPRHTARPA